MQSEEAARLLMCQVVDLDIEHGILSGREHIVWGKWHGTIHRGNGTVPKWHKIDYGTKMGWLFMRGNGLDRLTSLTRRAS
uniref:Variant erythrocyte surface antigen-1, alpha subunit n=1 Tax=Aureimonas altamirensis TaxID=370622 RepID=A0A0P0YXM7_9HYPH|nr:variant erythrocyte surface antigen-1, alpha subunit [Aureimonas altamirensis]